MLDLNGCWTGYYVLGPQYRYPHSFKVPFLAEIRSNGKEFLGTVREDVENGGIDDIAGISGKLYGARIEFIKSYTKYHYYESGELLADPDIDPMDISYFARFDEKAKLFLGNWYIKAPDNTAILGYGVWEMRKANCTDGFLTDNIDIPDVRSDIRIDGRHIDLTFKISEHITNGDYHILTALATYKFERIGFTIQIPSRVSGIHSGGFSTDVNAKARIVFRSLGDVSDRLIHTMAELFHLDTKSKFRQVVNMGVVSSSEDVADLYVNAHHDYGLILNADEDKFAKYYLSVDLVSNIVQLKEKDAWHRGNILSVFSE